MPQKEIKFQEFYDRLHGKANDQDARAFIDYWRTDFIVFSHEHEERTGNTLLHLAVKRSFNGVARDILELWRKIGGDLNCVDNKGRSPLHIAAESGNFEACAELLDRKGLLGVNIDLVDEAGRMPVHYAMEELEGRERYKMVKMFVENGTDLGKAAELIRKNTKPATVTPQTPFIRTGGGFHEWI